MESTASQADERLLRVLAEHLKLPLLQIAQGAELATSRQDVQALFDLGDTARLALRMVDGFLLGVGATQPTLLEPTSVSAALQETAHQLSGLASRYDCTIELTVKGKHGPVMADGQRLQAALRMVGQSLIEATPVGSRQRRIVLGAHQARHGIVAGVFADQPELTTDAFRRARALYGTARQPLPALSAQSGAGIYVAHMLLAAMQAPLHVARHNSLTGLAATLVPSRQLQLV